ncbi:hypothetical protein [Janthinobacterium sp.]|uniref:hypothetical protein n=1 Tax=Janthinobacterium sp. TaxID=1871054 RepID=UPI00293D6F2B|nr:hypothetical protein [Janthinobacterium sp.]
MAIVSPHPLYLLGLRFPRDLRVTVWEGALTLRNEVVSKRVARGESFVVPAFLRFACDVMPGAGRAAVFSLALEGDAGAPAKDGKRWSRELARLIFSAPQGKWTAVRLAALWQVTPYQARARLFAEGEALLSLVREQRLAHALHTAAQAQGGVARDIAQVAAEAGFASIPAFADACANVAGVQAGIFLRTVSVLRAAA